MLFLKWYVWIAEFFQKKKKIWSIIEIIDESSDRTKKKKNDEVFKCKERWSDTEWNIRRSNEITVFGKKKCFSITEKKSFVLPNELRKYKATYSTLNRKIITTKKTLYIYIYIFVEAGLSKYQYLFIRNYKEIILN